MADVQTNPYGNLKIKPSAHAPTLFSADPNVSTSQSHAAHDDSPLRSMLATDSPYMSGGGTFRARAAGSLSASRSRAVARDRAHNASMSMNNSLNNSMRTARPSPSPNLSMSQTRGRAVDYSKLSSDKFSDLLDRSLARDKDQSQISDTTHTPATNKENDNKQASQGKDERPPAAMLGGPSHSHSVFGGVSRDDTTLNGSHHLHATQGVFVCECVFMQIYIQT